MLKRKNLKSRQIKCGQGKNDLSADPNCVYYHIIHLHNMNHYYTLLHTIIIMIYVIAIFSNKQKFKQNVNTFVIFIANGILLWNFVVCRFEAMMSLKLYLHNIQLRCITLSSEWHKLCDTLWWSLMCYTMIRCVVEIKCGFECCFVEENERQKLIILIVIRVDNICRKN